MVEQLGLSPLPVEGGAYRKLYTHRLGASIVSESGYRYVGGAIKGKLYRIQSDQVWGFLTGEPVEILILLPDGRFRVETIGPLDRGLEPCAVIPKGCYRIEKSRGALAMVTSTPPEERAEASTLTAYELLGWKDAPLEEFGL